MTRHARILAASALLALALPAWAHPGHAVAAGFFAGLLHPLRGLDHLLAMTMLGLWGSQLGSAAQRVLPLAALAAMALGALAALAPVAPPAIETGVAASLLTLGLLVMLSGRLPLWAAGSLAAAFALCHGAAHGSELPELAHPLGYALGFLLTTAALIAAGLRLGSGTAPLRQRLAQLAGAAAVLLGLAGVLA